MSSLLNNFEIEKPDIDLSYGKDDEFVTHKAILENDCQTGKNLKFS